MWTEKKQNRFTNLIEAVDRGGLINAESDELQTLINERIRLETEATRNAAVRVSDEAELTRRRIAEAEAQSAALEELILEQEKYLSDVSSMISQMEAQRRKWRQRYKRLTGRQLKDPISPAGAR